MTRLSTYQIKMASDADLILPELSVIKAICQARSSGPSSMTTKIKGRSAGFVINKFTHSSSGRRQSVINIVSTISLAICTKSSR